MPYQTPLKSILHTLETIGELNRPEGFYRDLDEGMAEILLRQAAKFGEEILEPLHKKGDSNPPCNDAGNVSTTPGWKEAYNQWLEAGWNSLTGPEEFGGQALPHLIYIACFEIWSAANMAFALGPLLTAGAIEALNAHANEHLKALYLPKLISGEWMGTMNLTEPQAGSDLALVRTIARPQGDGSYRLKGQKIFISYGEHDLSENIIHLVLARLDRAPEGTRGLSLFLVPKFLPNADGSQGLRNEVKCLSLEHKIGIHGSPTATMSFGEKDGAVGWLVGEENRGLTCMFTMMNNARLGTGIQGVGLAEAAYQHALNYSLERRQGRDTQSNEAAPIISHPDVQRMLLTMQALTHASRAICYLTAHEIDKSDRSKDREIAAQAEARAALLTPLAKAFASDIGVEVASLGIQIFGGMGYIEETGAAQYWRDSRIVPIYEGTNGIQAIDLVQRKLPLGEGNLIRQEIADMRRILQMAEQAGAEFKSAAEPLKVCVEAFEMATEFMQGATKQNSAKCLAGAAPYLRLFGLARGGTLLVRLALAPHAPQNFTQSALFFAYNIAPQGRGLAESIRAGHNFVVHSFENFRSI